jgi:hypothetical protein
MSFLPSGIENYHLLWLLAVAFLPIILHILDKRRARIVDWPAMRFLVLRSQARLRRLQLKEALLILLRSLAVLALAGSILRPFSMETVTVRRKTAGSRGVVLVMDASFSMAYRAGAQGPSCLEKAKEAALGILDELGPGDTVAVVAGNPAAREAVRAGNPDDARRVVRDIRAGSEDFQLFPRLDEAALILARIPCSRLEAYVLTDLQRTALPAGDSSRWRFVRDRLRASSPPASVRIIDCGAPKPTNRFIAAVDPGPFAAVTGEAARIRIAVESSGPAGPGDPPADLRLVSEAQEIGASSVELPGQAPASVEIEHCFSSPGEARISAELAGDGLAEDDRRSLAMEVLERIDVLAVGTLPVGGRIGSAHYVDLALAPRAPGIPEPRVPFRVKVSESLTSGDLAGCRVVVLAELPRQAEAAAALESFVVSGGGLLAFSPEAAEFPFWNEHFFRGGRGILPASLSGRARDAGPGEHPRDLLTAHPALSIFSTPEEGDLSRITIGAWTRAGELSRDAQVLSRIDADSPWIVEKRAGRGRVIFLTTSAVPGDSDFPLTPLFLPALHHWTRYLAARDPSASSVNLGEPLELPVPPEALGSEAHVIDPLGKRHAVSISAFEAGLMASFAGTEIPGFYEIHVERPGAEGEARRIASRLFAANVSPAESRLDRASEETLAGLRQDFSLEVSRSAGEATGALSAEQVKRERWPQALAVALALLLAELALAGTFARGRAPWARGG